jgi:ribosome assembly protein RRB1
MSFKASDCDINVISWNTTSKFLLASGDDKGEFRIWDLRNLNQAGAGTGKGHDEYESITKIRWHTAPITSIAFEPREDSVLAVTSADDKMTLWDFSVEDDDAEMKEQQEKELEMEIPPQLMFLHQGQNNMKELRFHPQFSTLIVTTAEDSFNIFRPNLEPDEEDKQKPGSGVPDTIIEEDDQEETKQDSSASSSKQPV